MNRTNEFNDFLESLGEDFDREVEKKVVNLRTAKVQAVERRPPRRWFLSAPVLLATLAVGIAIGSVFMTGMNSSRSVRVAHVQTKRGPLRGTDDALQVQIQSPLDGFVTIVVLSSDRQLRVIPGFGADEISTSARKPSPWIVVDNDTERFLAIVTETPASTVIRRHIQSDERKNLTPDDQATVQSKLEQFLKKMGYRRVAIGSGTPAARVAE